MLWPAHAPRFPSRRSCPQENTMCAGMSRYLEASCTLTGTSNMQCACHSSHVSCAPWCLTCHLWEESCPASGAMPQRSMCFSVYLDTIAWYVPRFQNMCRSIWHRMHTCLDATACALMACHHALSFGHAVMPRAGLCQLAMMSGHSFE